MPAELHFQSVPMLSPPLLRPDCRYADIVETYNRQLLTLQGWYLQKAEALQAVERHTAQISEAQGQIQSTQSPNNVVLAMLIDSLHK